MLPIQFAHLLKMIEAHAQDLNAGAVMKARANPSPRPTVTLLFKPKGFVLLTQNGEETMAQWPQTVSGHEALTLIETCSPVIEAAQAVQNTLVQFKGLVNQCAHRRANLLFLRAHMALNTPTHFSGAVCGKAIGLESATAAPPELWTDVFDHRTPLLERTKSDGGHFFFYVESGKGKDSTSSKIKADTPDSAVDIHYALNTRNALETRDSDPIRVFQEVDYA